MTKKNTSTRIGSFIAGEIFQSKKVLKQVVPMLFVLLIFAIILVSNRYKVESLTKEKLKLQENVEYLKEKRVQMQRQYQESIRISRIDHVLDTVDVGLVAGTPFEIKIQKK